MDQFKQVLAEVKDRLDSFEAVSADSKWKNKPEVKRLLMGFTSKNKSYNYKMKLEAIQKKIIGNFDVTRAAGWKRHVASLEKTPEEMYAKWKQNWSLKVKANHSQPSSIQPSTTPLPVFRLFYQTCPDRI